MRAQRKKIFFHIGLEKTATTSFQRFCHENQNDLRKEGLLYPKKIVGRGINHKLLAASYLAHQPKDDRAFALFRPERTKLLRSLITEVERSDAPAVLISSEHMSSRFDHRAISTLADDFAQYDVEILVVIRDHYARFLSSYTSYIMGGGRGGMPDYEKLKLSPGCKDFSVRDMLSPWMTVFGRDRVRVLDYDAEPNVIAALLKACGCSTIKTNLLSHREKASPSPSVVHALHLLNQAIAARQTFPPDSSAAAWLQLMAFAALLRDRATRRAVQRSTPFSISWRALDLLDDTAARDRVWLEQRFGFTVSESTGRERMTVLATSALSQPYAQDNLGIDLVTQIPKALWGLSEVLVRLGNRLERFCD